MDFLKAALGALVLLSAHPSLGAPPEDLIQNPYVDPQLKRPLSENDLVFVDQNDPAGPKANEASLVTHNVIGRSLPDRTAQALFKMKKGEYVQILKPSKDAKWLAIYSLKARRRAWVPKGAIEQKPPLENPRK
jgi:hypothetical protein